MQKHGLKYELVALLHRQIYCLPCWNLEEAYIAVFLLLLLTF